MAYDTPCHQLSNYNSSFKSYNSSLCHLCQGPPNVPGSSLSPYTAAPPPQAPLHGYPPNHKRPYTVHPSRHERVREREGYRRGSWEWEKKESLGPFTKLIVDPYEQCSSESIVNQYPPSETPLRKGTAESTVANRCVMANVTERPFTSYLLLP